MRFSGSHAPAAVLWWRVLQSTGAAPASGPTVSAARPRGTQRDIDSGELDELRFHWGSAYDIGAADGVYTARRRDGKGDFLADALPEGLRLRIVADYERMPVPRDLP
jgi:hypothetical protein